MYMHSLARVSKLQNSERNWLASLHYHFQKYDLVCQEHFTPFHYNFLKCIMYLKKIIAVVTKKKSVDTFIRNIKNNSSLVIFKLSIICVYYKHKDTSDYFMTTFNILKLYHMYMIIYADILQMVLFVLINRILIPFTCKNIFSFFNSFMCRYFLR